MERASGITLVLFTVAMIGVGLWQVGSPEQARLEQRDELRMLDLHAYANFLTCEIERKADADLNCGAPSYAVDRFTLAPFIVENNRVCAVFEQDLQKITALDDQFKEGCLAIR